MIPGGNEPFLSLYCEVKAGCLEEVIIDLQQKTKDVSKEVKIVFQPEATNKEYPFTLDRTFAYYTKHKNIIRVVKSLHNSGFIRKVKLTGVTMG